MDKLIGLFKLLSDETRLRIVSILYHQELCVCEICGILELSQPKVSKHLAKMRDLGLVKDSRKEQFIYYSLNLENEDLKGIVSTIVENVNAYEVLKSDRDRLKSKNLFFDQCKKNSNIKKVDIL